MQAKQKATQNHQKGGRGRFSPPTNTNLNACNTLMLKLADTIQLQTEAAVSSLRLGGAG